MFLLPFPLQVQQTATNPQDTGTYVQQAANSLYDSGNYVQQIANNAYDAGINFVQQTANNPYDTSGHVQQTENNPYDTGSYSGVGQLSPGDQLSQYMIVPSQVDYYAYNPKSSPSNTPPQQTNPTYEEDVMMAVPEGIKNITLTNPDATLLTQVHNAWI